MDGTSAAGLGLLIAKMSAFALLVYASWSATRDVREAKARKAAEAEGTPAEPDLAETTPQR